MNLRSALHYTTFAAFIASLAGCNPQPSPGGPTAADQRLQAVDSGYVFQRGFPVGNTAQKAYDDNDLNRAVEAYKFFYPTVSGHAIFVGSEKVGIGPNKVWGTLDGQPRHVDFTLNSDTPYAPALIDLSNGPMVVELPPGPLICIAMDVKSALDRRPGTARSCRG